MSDPMLTINSPLMEFAPPPLESVNKQLPVNTYMEFAPPALEIVTDARLVRISNILGKKEKILSALNLLDKNIATIRERVRNPNFTFKFFSFIASSFKLMPLMKRIVPNYFEATDLVSKTKEYRQRLEDLTSVEEFLKADINKKR